jgi:vancomycin permeability regulator SanA
LIVWETRGVRRLRIVLRVAVVPLLLVAAANAYVLVGARGDAAASVADVPHAQAALWGYDEVGTMRRALFAARRAGLDATGFAEGDGRATWGPADPA